MGIKGLHKALSFCTVKDNLENYRGQRLAIDTSSWLHRSVYSFSEAFVETTDSGRIDAECVRKSSNYIFTRCKELLVRYNISTIYLVMDGKRCPLKADESQDREQKRRENLEAARKLKALSQYALAEEKYKSCIRIRNDFTKEVMRVVEKRFVGDGRATVVWSPYEADAQLAKLCVDNVADAVITEDSDVLVYSAAAHVAFPVLFKVDRSTGICDKISMDFLLSMSPEDVDKAVKSDNKLEVILRNLASRQSRRKGFGVRLFVQSCVLAGSDYSINTLEGIGLVGAFRLVRDNAFRNDNIRLKKILQSLPAKVKKKVDIDEYEERLAKSEAVFFYHLVKHIGGEVKPLLTPRLSGKRDGDSDDYTQHFPFMKRFEKDWSFIGGGIWCTQETDAHHSRLVEVDAILLANSTVSSNAVNATNKNESPKKRSLQKFLFNPYKKAKTEKDQKRQPLEERNTNSSSGDQQSKLQSGQHIKMGLDIMKYLQEMPDPRYVKRNFSSIPKKDVSSAKGPTISSSCQNQQPNDEHGGSEHHLNEIQRTSNIQFQHIQTPAGEVEVKHEKQCFETERWSHLLNAFQKDSETIVSPINGRYGALHRLQHLESNKPSVETKQPEYIDLTDSNDQHGSRVQTFSTKSSISTNKHRDCEDDVDEFEGCPPGTPDFEHDQSATKYFKKAGPRRVTLDITDVIEAKHQCSIYRQKQIFRGTPEKHWESDDLVDSPDIQRKHHTGAVFSYEKPNHTPKHSFAHASCVEEEPARVSSQPQKSSKSKLSGPLLAGFQRQQEVFGQMNIQRQFKPRSFAYSSTQKAKKSRDLTSYFQTAPKTSKLQFNQLPMNTNQSTEDWLWNG